MLSPPDTESTEQRSTDDTEFEVNLARLKRESKIDYPPIGTNRKKQAVDQVITDEAQERRFEPDEGTYAKSSITAVGTRQKSEEQPWRCGPTQRPHQTGTPTFDE